ncbi:MAG: hypothetical protein WD492_16520 [Alkalispirochaeta sp.]
MRPVRYSALILLCTILISAPIAAQDAPSFGFLIRQPQRGRAVPILPANSIRFIEAQYDVGGVPVDVFITTEAGVGDLSSTGPGDWDSVLCAEVTMQRFVRSSAERYVVQSDRDRYGLFVSTTLDTAVVCRFAASFIETFEFFLDELDGDLSEGPPPEFPAVIDLTQ